MKMIPRRCQVVFSVFSNADLSLCTDIHDDLENNILIIRISILARWDLLALTQGPGRCCALPRVALGLVLQHSVSAPAFPCCTWERDPFLDPSCVAFITAFVVCVHVCHALFCKPDFLLLWGYLAVFNCTILLLHRIGLSL